jgi:phage antirepressor YoqD-like protein
MQLLQVNGQLTMSSLELVEYINEERGDGVPQLRHDHFMAKVVSVLGIAAPKFMGTATYINGTGAEVSRNIYNFPKREACLMAMSYSYELQAKIFDRWYELETKQNQPAFKVPQTLSEALRLAADQQDTIVAQAAQLALAAPAVAFVEKFVEAKSSKCLSDVAKILGKKPLAFINQLSADHVIFKRNGSWIPYQTQLDAGRFTVKTGESSGHAYEQTRVEPKGIEWLARVYGE